MAIIPDQKSVDELFGTEKYYVDFYQREYKWNDNKQSYKPIKALLDDITYLYKVLLTRGLKSCRVYCTNEEVREYLANN